VQNVEQDAEKVWACEGHEEPRREAPLQEGCEGGHKGSRRQMVVFSRRRVESARSYPVDPRRHRIRLSLDYVLSISSVEDNTITETGSGLIQVVALPIDLIEHKEECLAGSKDLLHGHKVLAGSVA
jgi:hypothetical protein